MLEAHWLDWLLGHNQTAAPAKLHRIRLDRPLMLGLFVRLAKCNRDWYLCTFASSSLLTVWLFALVKFVSDNWPNRHRAVLQLLLDRRYTKSMRSPGRCNIALNGSIRHYSLGNATQTSRGEEKRWHLSTCPEEQSALRRNACQWCTVHRTVLWATRIRLGWWFETCFITFFFILCLLMIHDEYWLIFVAWVQ